MPPVPQQSLGQRAHYDAHYRRRRPRDLPTLRSASFITPPRGRGASGPTDELAEAIDARAGWLSAEDAAAEARLAAALNRLRQYDAVLVDVIEITCLRGRWSFALGGGLRHHDWRPAAELIGSGELAAEDLDRRTVDNWIMKGWEALGVLLATPAELRSALASNERTRWAHAQLVARGIL